MVTIKKNRLIWIDILEAIAIFFVVIYHASGTFSVDVTAFGVHNIILFGIKSIFSIGVPIFFICNGFLLLGKKIDVRKHLVKTVNMFVITMVWVLINTVFSAFEKHTFQTSFLVTEFVNHGFWFVYALVCIYILFPAIKYIFDNNFELFKYLFIITLVFTFGIQYIELIIQSFNNGLSQLVGVGYSIVQYINPLKSDYAYSFVYFMLGGMILKRDFIRTKKYVLRGLICWVLLVVEGVFKATHLNNNTAYDPVWNGYISIFTLGLAISVFELVRYLASDIESCRLITKISQNTLGIYYISTIIIGILNTYGLLDYKMACLYIVASVMILCISCLFSLIIKKIPVLKRLLY